MKIIKVLKKGISMLLISTLLLTSVCGCESQVRKDTAINDNSVSSIDTEKIAEEITNEIRKEASEKSVDEEYRGENLNEVEKNLEFFVYQKLFDEYSVAYDTFNAVLRLQDGTEVYGIGYSDFSCYLEANDGGKGLFPAGFLIADGDIYISKNEIEKGIEIENLDYEDDEKGFVLAYKTDSYYEHCVVDGKYVKYGIDDDGKIVHTECNFSRDVCDTTLGSLYSYDEERYLYDSEMGNYIPVSGTSLFEEVDYTLLEAEINRILEEQDFNYSSVSINTTVQFAKKAVESFLLSRQEETFLGCNVVKLKEEVSKLDPMECIQITPDGNVVINVSKDPPIEPSELAKWTVGISCGIAIAGSVALSAFVPASASVSGSICGAAVDVFMQVVAENNAVDNINWQKVAVSATAGALMAWACPLGAGTLTEKVAGKTGSELLSKLAGYGFLTFSNAIVSGSTNATFAVIDKKEEDEVFDSFLIGATLGACCTAAASTLGELGQAGVKALKNSRSENWFIKFTEEASGYVGKHQYHLKNAKLESILAPKSVYEASAAGIREYNRQIQVNSEKQVNNYTKQSTKPNDKITNTDTTKDNLLADTPSNENNINNEISTQESKQQLALNSGKKGGSYEEVKLTSNGEYTEVHETPAFSATGADKRKTGPSIKMTKEDHHQTASWGNSKDARNYVKEQKELIDQGKYHEAIEMDILDIKSKFGDKYDDAIEQMVEYAKKIGWW